MGGRTALTLVETLVTIAVVALLVALALPALRGMRASAQRTACLSNLRSIGHAIQSYMNANDGLLPYADRPVNLGAGLDQPLNTIASQLDLEPLRVADSGVRAHEVFICPGSREDALRRGWSYDYLPADLMAAWLEDPVQRGVSQYLSRDPSVVIVMDTAKVHPGAAEGSGFVGRNVLTLGGSAEAGTPEHRMAPHRSRP